MAAAPWTITSNTTKSTALAVGCLLTGALFLWLTRNASTTDSNAAAAMWLGVLLAAVGVVAIVFSEEVEVVIDPSEQRLSIERRTRWSTQRSELSFLDVESVNVVKIGTSSDGTPSYWIQIRLRDNTTLATGRWSTDQTEINLLAEKIANDIGCACRHGSPPAPIAFFHIVGAALGSILFYAVYYRARVGPLGMAMWLGTAPPVILLITFAALLGLLRRFVR